MTGRLKGAAVMSAVVLCGLSSTSCEMIQDCLECLCGDIEEGNSGITGNLKVDAFFQAVIELDAATQMVNMKMDDALTGLALSLGLEADASLQEIHDGIIAAMGDIEISTELEVEPARCEASVDVAVQAAAECDVTVDPGSVEVVCEGYCDGTCYAECDGECRLPSVDVECTGACYGSCSVEVTSACYGACYGECDGTAIEGATCEGVCTGTCETSVSGQCEGYCEGECVVEVQEGGCNAQCEGECQGHCEGGCEGEIVPPSVDAECEAQIEARVEASVECEPPEMRFSVDTSGVDNFLVIMNQVGQVYAAAREAERIEAGLAGFNATFGGAVEAMINGEVASNKVACALLEADDAAAILSDAIATLGGTIQVTVSLGLPPMPPPPAP